MTKSFGPVRALADVDLEIRSGEVRAVLGENGAGKSTLMHCVFGTVRADGGSLCWKGRRVDIRSPIQACELGIGMVHQEFALVDALSTVENLALCSSPNRAVFLDREAIATHMQQRARDVGLDIGNPAARVGDLPVGVRQRIEILKALSTNPELLILDEPTAVLTPNETQHLFSVLQRLRAQGVAIAIITHKLPEVMAVADTITVMRRGRVIRHAERCAVDEAQLATWMVGRAPIAPAAPPRSAGHTMHLQLESVGLRSSSGTALLDDIDLAVAGGTVFGIAGVDGNGQHELFEITTGMRRAHTGRIRICGAIPQRTSAAAFAAAGVSAIPPDRRRHGAVLEMRLWENALLAQQTLADHSRLGLLQRAKARAFAAKILERFAVVRSSDNARATELSGGNLQKLIVGRALARHPPVLIACNPTRGLDIGAAAAVHEAILQARAWAGAVLLLSTDLDEVLALSDRIAVLYRGTLSHPFTPPYAREQIGRWMSGAARPQTADTPCATS